MSLIHTFALTFWLSASTSPILIEHTIHPLSRRVGSGTGFIARVEHFPAVQDQTKEEKSSVSIKDLRNAPTVLEFDNRFVKLSAYPWRDFMPGPPGPRPLMVGLKLMTSDEQSLPAGIWMDRAWVLFGEEVWEVTTLGRRLVSVNDGKDTWLNCSNKPSCEISIGGGPPWPAGGLVDVVVRLRDSEGRHHLLLVRHQKIETTS